MTSLVSTNHSAKDKAIFFEAQKPDLYNDLFYSSGSLQEPIGTSNHRLLKASCTVALSTTMKVTSSLAFITIFAAAASAFGLNGPAQSFAKSTKSIAFGKQSNLVQPVDIQGNRINSVVSRGTKPSQV